MSQNKVRKIKDLGTTNSPGSANCQELPTFPIVQIQRLTYSLAYDAALELVRRIDDQRIHIRNNAGELITDLEMAVQAILNDDLMIGGVE